LNSVTFARRIGNSTDLRPYWAAIWTAALFRRFLSPGQDNKQKRRKSAALQRRAQETLHGIGASGSARGRVSHQPIFRQASRRPRSFGIRASELLLRNSFGFRDSNFGFVFYS
jgi:hypothetical protein